MVKNKSTKTFLNQPKKMSTKIRSYKFSLIGQDIILHCINISLLLLFAGYNCNSHLLLAASMHCRDERSSVHCHVHPSSSCTHCNFLSHLVERNTLLGKVLISTFLLSNNDTHIHIVYFFMLISV